MNTGQPLSKRPTESSPAAETTLARKTGFATKVLIALTIASPSSHAQTEPPTVPVLPQKMQCQALQTVGLHDYAGAPESYEPSTFFESKFELRINRVLTRHLAAQDTEATAATPDLFLTMRPRNSRPIELRCRQVQGASGELGYSCTNTPPSELLLINPKNLRFTRTSIGGWTFSDTVVGPKNEEQDSPATGDEANLGDDSLFVEYGNCS